MKFASITMQLAVGEAVLFAKLVSVARQHNYSEAIFIASFTPSLSRTLSI